MVNIFLFILMGFGAVLVWKRLTGKASGASSALEAGGVFFFLLFASSILAFFMLGAIGKEIVELFPELRGNIPLAFIICLIVLTIYLWTLFRLSDWVTGGESKHNTDK